MAPAAAAAIADAGAPRDTCEPFPGAPVRLEKLAVAACGPGHAAVLELDSAAAMGMLGPVDLVRGVMAGEPAEYADAAARTLGDAPFDGSGCEPLGEQDGLRTMGASRCAVCAAAAAACAA